MALIEERYKDVCARGLILKRVLLVLLLVLLLATEVDCG